MPLSGFVCQSSSRCSGGVAMWLMLTLLSGTSPCLGADGGDVVEFLNGSQLTGKVVDIRVPEKQFDFETRIGTRSVKRTYDFSDVHAVTMRGKRHILTEKAASDSKSSSGPPQRTRVQVQALIKDAGSTQPDWYAATNDDYPPTLDLSWPIKPEGKWNNQKNVGQYIWDVVNPNPKRWKSGVKLVHQVLEKHQHDAALLRRDRTTLGRMYFELLQDYPRAAYWFEQAQVGGQEGAGVKLAECYWRLGNAEMAIEVLTQPRLPFSAVKLLGELGRLDTALRLAKAYEGTNAENNARILAADALRLAGRLDDALAMYQQVVDSDTYRNADYEKRFKGRAQDSIEAIQLFDKAQVENVRDGRYRDQSIGYNGPVEVEVVVQDGRIEQVSVVKHREKQFYSALTDTPQQILQKQSVQDIDGFSGATITSNAIVNASAKALAKGSR